MEDKAREAAGLAHAKEVLGGTGALLSFEAGASWVLKNLPRCGSCRYWKQDEWMKPNLGFCTNSIFPVGDYASSSPETEADFGCVLHSELEEEK